LYVAIQGTRAFDNYQVFLRAMGVAMSIMGPEDKEFILYSAGPVNVNNYVSEFCNMSETGLKNRGKSVKYYRVAPSWIQENLTSFNYFAFLSKPSESVSKLAGNAELNGVEVGIFRY
jgi:hypothetical protein